MFTAGDRTLQGKARSWLFTTLAALLGASLLTGCGAGDASSGAVDSSEAGKLTVVCTTGMIADAARQIGGEHARATGLMGPGVDPHLYTATRQDQRRLLEADLVLYHGLHLEGKMADFLKDLASSPRSGQLVAAVAEVVHESKILHNPLFGEYPDPHVWFDLELWSIVVGEIVRAFEQRDPAHAAEYRRRGEAYERDIAEAHAWGKEMAAGVPQERRRIVTSHDAYNYFGRAYGFEVRGLQGISTVTKAGLKDIKEAVKYVRQHDVPVIFAETSVSPAAVETVAGSAGCRVCEHHLYSDAIGLPGTPEGTFLGVFRFNMRAIVEALRPATDG